jgi:hypothetical protein
VLRDCAACSACSIGSTGQIGEPDWIGECPVKPVPPDVGDIGAVPLGDAVAVGQGLQSEVHQLAAVGQVVEDVCHVHVPLVAEVGQRAGQKAIDDSAVLAFDAQRFDRALQRTARTERGRGIGRAQDAPPVSISVAKWSGSPSAARIALAMLATS